MANGLDYVRCRMKWYMALVKTILDDCHTKDSQLCEELKHRIQELYVSILTYEMQCVRSYYHDNLIVRGLRAVVALDDWKCKVLERCITTRSFTLSLMLTGFSFSRDTPNSRVQGSGRYKNLRQH